MYIELQEENLFSHLAAAYRQLHQRLCALRKTANEIRNSPTNSQWNDLENLLCNLRAELGRHFEQEDNGGLLDEAAANRPAIGYQIDLLFKEHHTLLQDFDRLLHFSRGKTLDPKHWLLVQEELASLLSRIQAYQKQSNNLLQLGFNVDCRDLLD